MVTVTVAARDGSGKMAESRVTVKEVPPDPGGNGGGIGITGGGGNSESNGASIWQRIGQWIVRYIFFGWAWQKDPIASTEEQKVNQAMKEKVASAINAYSNWGRMTANERQAALTELLGQAETILGVSKQNIAFHNLGVHSDGSITMGIYYTSAGPLETTTETVQIAAKTMVINTHTRAIGSADIRKTVFHEVRHAYQSEAREDINKHVVSEATYDFWADSYRRTVEKDGWIAYLSSPREWDARQLAGQSHKYNGKNVTPVYSGNWPS